MLIRFLYTTVLGLLGLLAFMAMTVGESMAKEPLPIQGDFIPASIDGKAGQTVEVGLRLSFQQTFEGVEILLKLPDSIVLATGESTRQLRDLRPETPVILSYNLFLKTADPAQVVIVARVLGLGDEVMNAAFVLPVNPPPIREPKIKTDKNGRTRRVRSVPAKRGGCQGD